MGVSYRAGRPNGNPPRPLRSGGFAPLPAATGEPPSSVGPGGRLGARSRLQQAEPMVRVFAKSPRRKEALMTRGSRKTSLVSLIAGAALLASATAAPAFAEDAKQQGSAEQQPPEKHHSKAKGALVGGVGGAVVGGKKGAVAGAAGGALYQRHRNKKAEKKQEKQSKQQEK